MAASFFPTGSYSNLTRLQLEQLRKSDFYAAGKALTVGDSDNAADTTPFNPVGVGDVNAEQFFTNPSLLLTDVYSLTPPLQPGPGLGAVTQVAPDVSETVTWYGPTQLGIYSGATGLSATQVQSTFTDFGAAGVLPGDVVLLTAFVFPPLGDLNSNVVATVVSISTTTKTNDTLTLTNIVNPNFGSSPGNIEIDFGFGTVNGIVVIRPSAVRLFAYPGSGPTTGQEQTFLAVNAATTIHSLAGPTTAQINAARVTNIVPPNYNAVGNDQADSVYGFASPRTGLGSLGYRWIVYPDLGLGLSGAAASVSSFTTPTATITGLSGLTSAVVGKYLTIVHATTTANNGTFLITSFISATSVGVDNPNAVAGDANNTHITWSVIGPNLAAPISSTTPINTIVPSTDDRFTFDYKAGIFRLSAAPNAGIINKAVDPASGRLNLWSVFWSVDTSLTAGTAPSLYGIRSSNTIGSEPAGKITFNATTNVWEVNCGLQVDLGAQINGAMLVEGGLTVDAADNVGVLINFDGSNPLTFLVNMPSPSISDVNFNTLLAIWEYADPSEFGIGVRTYALNSTTDAQLQTTTNAKWNGADFIADNVSQPSTQILQSKAGWAFSSQTGSPTFSSFGYTPFTVNALGGVTLNFVPTSPQSALIETPSPIPFGPENGANVLIWEFMNTGAVGVRMYASNLNNYSQVLITNNASWNGTQWVLDDAGINASVFTLSRNGASFSAHNGGSSPFASFEATPISVSPVAGGGVSAKLAGTQTELLLDVTGGSPQTLTLASSNSLFIDVPGGSGTFTVNVTGTATGTTSSIGTWFQDFWIRIRQTSFNYTLLAVNCDNGTVVHFEPGTLDNNLSDVGTDLYHGVIMNGICYMSVQRFPGV